MQTHFSPLFLHNPMLGGLRGSPKGSPQDYQEVGGDSSCSQYCLPAQSLKSPRSLRGSQPMVVPAKVEPKTSVIPQPAPRTRARSTHSPPATPWGTLRTSKASSPHRGPVPQRRCVPSPPFGLQAGGQCPRPSATTMPQVFWSLPKHQHLWKLPSCGRCGTPEGFV